MSKKISEVNDYFSDPKKGEFTYTGAEPVEILFKGEVLTMEVGDILDIETGEIERAIKGES